jgi:predicted esterase
VALHGDGGGVRRLVRSFQAAADEAGVILLAPLCPRALGCTAGSFWKWLDTSGHDPAWLGAQIDAVTVRFSIDPRRIYAAGYSGGATYLGWYAPAHADRFAAVAHVAGGAAYRPPCPACKVPVLFLLGTTDPMIGPYTRPLRDWYASCEGHEISWETLPGVTHESILDVLSAGRARQILGWLLARPLACAAPDRSPPTVTAPAAGPADGSGADGGPRVAPPVEVARAADPPAADAGAPAPPRVPPAAAGCACGVGRDNGPAGVLAGLIGLLGLACRGARPRLGARRSG